MKISDFVMEYLANLNIDTVFCVTGGGAMHLNNSLGMSDKLTGVFMLHEQGASIAAEAYARIHEGYGACLVTSGPGATNAVTGCVGSYIDSIPVIYISGQAKRADLVGDQKIRQFGIQEVDIISIVKSYTKYAVQIDSPEKIKYELEKASFLAMEGRPGPVWIDIPLDIQASEVNPDALNSFYFEKELLSEKESIIEGTYNSISYAVKSADIDTTIEAINKSTKPVRVLGHGIRLSHSVSEARELFEFLGFPVLTSWNGVDLIESDHPLYYGRPGAVGQRAANLIEQGADIVITIGTRLNILSTGYNYDSFLSNAYHIMVDIDENEHSKGTVRIDKLILSDAKFFIEALLKENLNETTKEWQDKCKHWKQVFPKCEVAFKSKDKMDIYDFADSLTNHLKDDAVILTDAGLEEVIVPTVVGFKDGQRCLHPASQGCMGVALPASMGAWYSSGHDVIAVIGDGSVMMNLQEMQTISANKMGVKIIIINNKVYSVIRTRQIELFRNRTIGTNPENGVTTPDFKDVAQCFKIPYVKINDTTEFDTKIEEALNMEGPVICEVMAVEDQVYIRNGAGFNAQRKFVVRPLEDQMPFMDREVLKNEMIVEPIDL